MPHNPIPFGSKQPPSKAEELLGLLAQMSRRADEFSTALRGAERECRALRDEVRTVRACVIALACGLKAEQQDPGGKHVRAAVDEALRALGVNLEQFADLLPKGRANGL